MEKPTPKIHIIGAGVSGLVAAKVLTEAGYQPTVLEATESPGGRVKTDTVGDYQLDHGFQVLLTAYPAARRHLDYEALGLQHLVPGAVVYHKGNKSTIGDPQRQTSMLLPTLMAQVGGLGDKLKVLKLARMLKKKNIGAIFGESEQTTLAYLQDFGFSEKMIQRFFKPFFSGIFLEPDLATPSRMFQFVYKMFGEGVAALPKAGMGAIAQQLASRLPDDTIRYDQAVRDVAPGRLALADGVEVASDYTIIATEANGLVANMQGHAQAWKSCDTLYFSCPSRTIAQPLIGLVADEGALVNNIFYHTSVATAAHAPQELLSVTIVKPHMLDQEDLIAQAQQELRQYCGIETEQFIKHYRIQKALPDLDGLQHDMAPSATKLADGIFLAGDTLLNGSLNAAMTAGERAAQGAIAAIRGTDGLF